MVTWKEYYNRFYDWEESTQLRHLSSLTDFGPSAEVCELACDFFEEKSANRFVKKAIASGVRFTAEEVLELDGVVDMSLMPQLIKNTSHALTAEQLDDFVFWLSSTEIREIAKRDHIRLDVEAEQEFLEAEKEAELTRKELEQLREDEEARATEELLIAKAIYAICSKRRRERRKKRREGR